MDFSHKIVLVTGAGGFIGSHLVEQLVAHSVRTRALVRYSSTGSLGWLESSSVKNDVQVVLGDIRDPDIVRRAMRGVDVVFHLAALIGIPYSYHAPLSYVRTNVEGTVNLLNAALDANVQRFVHTSTSEVYGSALRVPIDEDHPLQGQSPYSASKIAADKQAEAFHRSFGLPVVTVRPFNTYGPRQSARAVIPTIITQAITRSAVHIGDLRPTRDFNYVSDTVAGFLAAATCDAAIGQVIHLGTGREISIGDLAQLIFRLMGKSPCVESDAVRLRPEASEVERLIANPHKAHDLLGWKPQVTLEQGLAQTISWIEANLHHYAVGNYQI